MAWQGPEAFIAVDGKGSDLGRGERDDDRLAGPDILLDGQLFDDKVMRRDECYARQGQFYRLAGFNNKMARGIGVAIKNNGGSLHSVSANGDGERRAWLSGIRCVDGRDTTGDQEHESPAGPDSSHG